MYEELKSGSGKLLFVVGEERFGERMVGGNL